MAYSANQEPTGLTAKVTPVDADVVIIGDSADAVEVAKKTTWANIKATLKTYNDTLYAAVLGADDNYATDAEKTKLSNLSGTNTGDQTVTNSSDATSHTVTLSASGGSVQLIEGTNITLTTGGTGSAGTVTITASGGSGDVTKVGTPADNQIGVWTGNGTIEGDTALTFDTATDTLTIGASGNLNFGAVTVIDDNAGTTTLQNIDALDATTETTIEAAIDTLANLASVNGYTFSVTANGTVGGTNTGDQTSIVGITGTMAQFDTAVSDGNIVYQSQALGTPASGTLTNCTGLPVNGIVDDTSSALGVGTLEVGHASDTTISRSAAGKIAVEGVEVLTVAGGTLTGNIVLGENTSIDLDPAGSADGKYSGIAITGTAGAALAFGDLVYLAAADSRWELTDADATATAGTPLIGMCVLAAAGDGSATKILLQGTIRADSKFPALTIGAPAYVGETAGAIQTAIPTGADNVIRVVGRALTADELYFCPSQDHQITVA